MATINFLIQSTNDPAGIYVRLRVGRSIDLKAKTNFLIAPNDWSNTKGKPKHLREASFKKLDEDLNKTEADLLSHYNNSIGKVEVNIQWLKDFINPPQQAETITNSLVNYFDYYSKHKKNVIGYTTSQKIKVIKHLIERFQEHTGESYLIKDVNADFKLKLEKYCREQKYATNTIAAVIRFIKTLCYHARNNGIETNFQLDGIIAKKEKVEKIFLTPEELAQIEKAKLEFDHLLNARDWLIISCETGQRVSDFMRFTKDQIRVESGKKLIEFTQVKTDKLMTVPLSSKVQGILKKHKGEFPRAISDQRYNEYIKEVCRVAGIKKKTKGSKNDPETNRKESGTFEKWELVSSHIGRRSFATNNYGRIPTSLLMGATGHTTEGMFLEYIGKSNSEKAMQLADYIK